LINSGVVCKTAADGELLLELYSLLECLEPDEHNVATRLSQLRFVPARTADLGLYLVYIPLPDVLVYLVPASTLPEAQALRRQLATAGLPRPADLGHLCAGLSYDTASRPHAILGWASIRGGDEDILRIITVYIPQPPKWHDPRTRGRRP
jgi:hypothetical protein